jgi:sirohydrochlorin ferrochelatase
MPTSTISSPRGSRDGAAQLQLVRRYARLLRETTTEGRSSRRSTTRGATRSNSSAAGGRRPV